MPRNAKSVGITLVTGFLGSGKSTLINRILVENHGLRIVVIENEFASTAQVERAIVTQGSSTSANDFIQLPNGCICCAALGDLADTLYRLVASRNLDFDHILVEASGLADPIPVVSELWTDDAIEGLYLDGVVAIVDAINIKGRLEGGDMKTKRIAERQVAIADLVLLNKQDLLEEQAKGEKEEAMDSLRKLLRNHGCHANTVTTTRCDVPIADLLGLHAYDGKDPANYSALYKGAGKHEHGHSSSINTITLSFKAVSFDESKLDCSLGEILWNINGELKFEVWRMKALVVVARLEHKRIYQAVNTLFDFTDTDVGAGPGEEESCFIFIGKELDSDVIEGILMKAIDGERDVVAAYEEAE